MRELAVAGPLRGGRLALGLGLVALGWGVSLAGVEPVRQFWYPTVWAGAILAADTLVLARTGDSLLSRPARRVAWMFAASAVFWWGYEAVNWHTRNWSYEGSRLGPALSLGLKWLSFTTVLPILAESRDLLRSFLVREGRVPRRLRLPPLPLGRAVAWGMVAAGLAGALLVWRFPDQAFPLIWVVPFLVVDGAAELRGRPSALAALREGRGHEVLIVALAGLCAGPFWELWNYGAQPHWEYRVPYVGFLKVFEMPILGYLGYLPFALVADAVWRAASGGWGGLAGEPVTDVGGRTPSRRAAP